MRRRRGEKEGGGEGFAVGFTRRFSCASVRLGWSDLQERARLTLIQAPAPSSSGSGNIERVAPTGSPGLQVSGSRVDTG